jgi:hypothetical protein
MVVGLPKKIPPNGVSKGCVLGKHHHAHFNSRKIMVSIEPPGSGSQ